MKAFILLLLSSALLFAQLNISNPFFVGGVLKPAGGATITVDFWEDFEFGSDADSPTALQLEAAHAPYTNNWTFGGTTSLNLVRTAAQKAFTSTINSITDSGTRGLEMDINAGNTAARYYYMNVQNGANATSYAVWFQATSLVASVGVTQPILLVWDSVGNVQTRVLMGTDVSANPELVLDNLTSGGSIITLSPTTWYRIEVRSVRNASSTLEVFNTSGTSQGTSTITATDKDFDYILIGNSNTYLELGSIYFDNLIVSKSGTSPLGP